MPVICFPLLVDKTEKPDKRQAVGQKEKRGEKTDMRTERTDRQAGRQARRQTDEEKIQLLDFNVLSTA